MQVVPLQVRAMTFALPLRSLVSAWYYVIQSIKVRRLSVACWMSRQTPLIAIHLDIEKNLLTWSAKLKHLLSNSRRLQHDAQSFLELPRPRV